MKYNYSLFALIALIVAYHVYVYRQAVALENNLTQLHGTLHYMAEYSSYGGTPTQKMTIKEYPGVKFAREVEGWVQSSLDKEIDVFGKEKPGDENHRLPDSLLKVKFYVAKNASFTHGSVIDYFYLQKENEVTSKNSYSTRLLFYKLHDRGFIGYVFDGLALVLLLTGFQFETKRSVNPYTLTFKGKVLLIIAVLGVLLNFL